ncbi:hypothetical protein FRB94_003618 [Tulasnella sp. JGI-2019a]|nr:hypothetical protein FRB94_003618 [Tulasnella sp. JGI-2019a]KAG9008910.1 hypothetical protein FRB93_005960 [Tulasnella sp. JGI-2019a]KAG9038231.1 hypothetical protein FRB95_002192 [Tulasnella sp. JGI-2019a]
MLNASAGVDGSEFSNAFAETALLFRLLTKKTVVRMIAMTTTMPPRAPPTAGPTMEWWLELGLKRGSNQDSDGNLRAKGPA